MRNDLFMSIKVLGGQIYLDVCCATSEMNTLIVICPEAGAFMILKLRDVRVGT